MKIRIINSTSRAYGPQINLNCADNGLGAQLRVECFGILICRDNIMTVGFPVDQIWVHFLAKE